MDIKPERSVNALILGAGREPIGSDGDAPLPRCLLTEPFGSSVIDWILTAFRKCGVKRVSFVGGYRIDEIGKRYPDLDYIYNPEWRNSGVLESLYHARKEFEAPLLISYADVVYSTNVCKAFLHQSTDFITVAIDSTWRPAEAAPTEEGHVLRRKNLVRVSEGYVRDIGFLRPSKNVTGEFVGLVSIGSRAIKQLQDFFGEEYCGLHGQAFEQADDVRAGYITDLLRYFLHLGIPITAVDIGAEWAEMDHPGSLARFVLGTKSDTLDRIAPMIKTGAAFCDQYSFKVAEWQTDSSNICKRIQQDFSPDKIAVRSSAIIEDSWNESNAGHFDSVLNVESSDNQQISAAIDQVIASYGAENDIHVMQSQVLVQKMVNEARVSGVVLTREHRTGAPYYVVNYDQVSRRTDGVTSGMTGGVETLYVYRGYGGQNLPSWIDHLITNVREIERIVNCTSLDIEFAVDDTGVLYILQIRPLVSVVEHGFSREDPAENIIGDIRAAMENLFVKSSSLYGESTILADMPDWNVAELIGVTPAPLSLSLFQYLIMDRAWREARARIGYHHPRSKSLMVSIAGHPYIDTRVSFNSLLPGNLPDALAEKLVNHYIRRLKNNPHLHDKIEFDVCVTCYDFSFDMVTERLLSDGFSSEEVALLGESLKSLTNDIIKGRREPLSKIMKEFSILNERTQMLSLGNKAVCGIPGIIKETLDDCVEHGVIPFSIVARYAFIANALLKSLVCRGVLSEAEMYSFLRSIDSVATEMAQSLASVYDGDLDLDAFLKMYGHLRPGTFDVTSLRYDEGVDVYFPEGVIFSSRSSTFRRASDETSFEFSPEQVESIQRMIDDAGFDFSVQEMTAFIKAAIAGRERGKFELSKSISNALKLLTVFGAEYGFEREALSHISIYKIIEWGSQVSAVDYRTMIWEEIKSGQHWAKTSQCIILPHFIDADMSIDVIQTIDARPNFVTHRKVTAATVVLDGVYDVMPSLDGCIVMIEAADPGYDWILMHNIAGLITKYGGAASHMAIRAAEFDLPAAIGCGEALFNDLAHASIVELNCRDKVVRSV